MEYRHGGPGTSVKQQYRPSGSGIGTCIGVYAVDGEGMEIVGGVDLVYIEAIEEV